jgi:hypothetical protein
VRLRAAQPRCVSKAAPHAQRLGSAHGWRRAGRAPGGLPARERDGPVQCSMLRRIGLLRRGAGGAQGEHLAEPLECVFTNGSLSLAVRAAVSGAGGATCVAPAWPLDRSGARPPAGPWIGLGLRPTGRAPLAQKGGRAALDPAARQAQVSRACLQAGARCAAASVGSCTAVSHELEAARTLGEPARGGCASACCCVPRAAAGRGPPGRGADRRQRRPARPTGGAGTTECRCPHKGCGVGAARTRGARRRR